MSDFNKENLYSYMIEKDLTVDEMAGLFNEALDYFEA